MTTCKETIEQIMEEEYVFPCKEINDTFVKDIKQILKNALRELNQKRIKDYRPIVNYKKKFRKGCNNYDCPRCQQTECWRLTCSHIGVKQSDIIDEILQHSLETGDLDFVKLYDIVIEKHNDVYIAVCCDKCNKIVETPQKTIERMMEEEYVFPCKEINDTFVKDNKQILKNALRELNQKRIKDYRPIVNYKKKFRKGNNNYDCPRCQQTKCWRLTCSHIGVKQSDIIDEILQHSLETGDLDFEKLYDIVIEKHNDVYIAVCCDKCNKIVENIKISK